MQQWIRLFGDRAERDPSRTHPTGIVQLRVAPISPEERRSRYRDGQHGAEEGAADQICDPEE